MLLPYLYEYKPECICALHYLLVYALPHLLNETSTVVIVVVTATVAAAAAAAVAVTVAIASGEHSTLAELPITASMLMDHDLVVILQLLASLAP